MSDEGQPVIVGIDGSDHSIMAARWAGAVAGKLGAPLCIVHAVPDINYILSGLPTANRNPTEKMQMAAAAQASLQQSAHGVLDKADRAVRSDPRDLPVATESVAQVPGESAGEALVRLSRGARLFVIGCDDVGRAGALLSSEMLALAAHASCPVVAWRGDVVTPNDRPILVGVDDDGAAAVLPIAFEFARRFGVSLIALRAWSRPPRARRCGDPVSHRLGRTRPRAKGPLAGRFGAVDAALSRCCCRRGRRTREAEPFTDPPRQGCSACLRRAQPSRNGCQCAARLNESQPAAPLPGACRNLPRAKHTGMIIAASPTDRSSEIRG